MITYMSERDRHERRQKQDHGTVLVGAYILGVLYGVALTLAFLLLSGGW